MNPIRKKRCALSMFLVCAVLSPIALAQDVCMQTHVHPHDPFPFKNFGRAVDMSGDTAIVGAKWDNDLGTEAGAAYVFEFDGNTWTQIQKLLASDAWAGQEFGRDVVIQDNTTFIGANDGVYIFDYLNGQWVEQQKLVGSDAPAGFGESLAIHNDVLVVGSMHDDTQGPFAGAAWVFRYNGSQWVEEQKLLASDGAEGYFFGSWQAVDVHGDFIAIGAHGHMGLNPPKNPPLSLDAGVVYIFHYDGKSWNESQILAPLSPQSMDKHTSFGKALGIHGNRLVVGNPNPNQFSAFDYQYDASRNAWVLQEQIMPPDGALADGWGKAISIENDTMLIGDWLSNLGGAAFIYQLDNNNLWQVEQTLYPEPNDWGNMFGRDVALDNGRAIIGANGEDQQSGAAYMFNINTPTGDLNCDGTIGVIDLLQLLASWGACNDCSADINASGAVDTNDLLTLLANWG